MASPKGFNRTFLVLKREGIVAIGRVDYVVLIAPFWY